MSGVLLDRCTHLEPIISLCYHELNSCYSRVLVLDFFVLMVLVVSFRILSSALFPINDVVDDDLVCFREI